MSLAAGLAVLVAVAWSSVGVAWAHEVGLSRGVYTLTGPEVAAELTFARAELLGLAPTLDGDGDGVLTDAELSSGTAALQLVVDGVQLTGDGQACASAWVDAALTEEDGARVRLRFTSPRSQGASRWGCPCWTACGLVTATSGIWRAPRGRCSPTSCCTVGRPRRAPMCRPGRRRRPRRRRRSETTFRSASSTSSSAPTTSSSCSAWW